MEYQRSIDLDQPYEDAVTAVKQALADQGFGVLSEIDVQGALRDKRGIEIEPYLILGACNPDLAHRALEVDRSIGVLLPCNVVVSGRDDGSTVRVLDPRTMSGITGRADLDPVSEEAAERLDAALAALAGT